MNHRPFVLSMVAITGIGIMALLVIAGFGIMQDTKDGGVRQDTPESLLSSYARFYNARNVSGIAALIIPPQDPSLLSHTLKKPSSFSFTTPIT